MLQDKHGLLEIGPVNIGERKGYLFVRDSHSVVVSNVFCTVGDDNALLSIIIAVSSVVLSPSGKFSGQLTLWLWMRKKIVM